MKLASCRVEVIFAIRDAEGLTSLEKLFLFTVESRGVMTTTATRAAKDMGISRATFYRIRDSLMSKGLLEVSQSETVTRYRVSLCETPSVSERDSSVSERAPEEVQEEVTKEKPWKKHLAEEDLKYLDSISRYNQGLQKRAD